MFYINGLFADLSTAVSCVSGTVKASSCVTDVLAYLRIEPATQYGLQDVDLL